MGLVLNRQTGELRVVDGDPAGLLEQGWSVPTEQEIASKREELQYGTVPQQAQAQAERVVRGGTLGLVEGFGDDPEAIRARADVSQRLSPVTSFAADVAPDVAVGLATGGLGGLASGAGRAAGRSALTEGAGLVRAGLAAGRAGGVAALAGESLGSGAVAAGQQAFAEGRPAWEDIGRDAENALIWGGLNLGIGGIGLARAAKGRAGAKAVEEAVEEVDDVARHAEVSAAPAVPEQVIPTLPDGTPVSLVGVELKDLMKSSDVGMRSESLDFLRQDERFARTGKGFHPRLSDEKLASGEGLGFADGIILRQGPGGFTLQDGRHRITAARERDMPEIFGRVLDKENNPVFEGMIPIAAPKGPKVTSLAEKEAVEDGLDRAVAKASQAEADDIVERAVGKAEPEATSLGRQRRLYQNRKAIIDTSTREMQEDLTRVVKDTSTLSGTEKLAAVSRHVSDNVAAQRVATKAVADDAAKFAGELRAEAKALAAESGKKGLEFAVPGQKGLVKALMDHAKEVVQAKTGKEMFEKLNAFKQVADEVKISLEAGALNSDNPLYHQRLIPKVQDFAGRIRKALEDQKTWGQAGEMQGAYNAVIHERLLPSMRIFEESVLKRTHRGYDAIWATEGWETKIKGLLANTDPGERRHVASVLDAMQELASARTKYEPGDAAAKEVAKRVEKIRRTIGLADEVADASERMGAMSDLAGAVPLFGGAMKQFVTGDVVANMRRLAGATDAAVSRSVDDWIASSRVRGRGAVSKLVEKFTPLSAEAKQLAEVAKRRGVSHGMALFMGEDESPAAAFEKRRDALMNDEKFFEMLGQDYRSLQALAPEAYIMVSGMAAADRQFLLERMPPNVSVSMLRPSGYPPSNESVEDWAVYWNTLRDPMRAIGNLPSIRVQELETIKTRRRRLYEQLQATVIEKIAAAQTAGEPLDDTLLMRLDTLFQMDGAASTAFSYSTARAAREYEVSQQQQGKPQSGGGTPSAVKLGGVNQTAETGITFGTSNP